ncbi:adenosine deaminase [Halioxenophilus sp. WMMB6]|uniref:adenosine deaminase family protein n=1 Tax=Halioxenophilus sp. WMMB6 TaxID=3073815 RepID=UPI00295EDD06|nr:adenosine deaminase [Halioxenophilus sp. WMMB6]
MNKFKKHLLLLVLVPGLLLGRVVEAASPHDWFEQFKASASDAELYQFLYLMPKGGDLHNHLSGSGLPQWWYDGALAQSTKGYNYYTKIKIENCRGYGGNAFGGDRYYLMFRNISARTFAKLPACEQAEYKPLVELSAEEKAAWLDSIRLDKLHEGRNEFFETHWQRLNELTTNPYLIAEILYQNMAAFGAEGMLYLETQAGADGYLKADGTLFAADEVVAIFRERINRKDALATGVTVRFQSAILRFLPSAEQDLKRVYQFVHEHNDLWVGVNMVGREDNDKGYPLRFLPTLRELRQRYSGVKLSIHAGEVDEPNDHVKDTLLLGADRIGHGVNLITDPETMVLMRHGPYMVEINLISNKLLEYVQNYAQHPFPEYLRVDIPVALSTDDRGMWDSRLTDEFFVAVKEFDLSWEELQTLHNNSLQYSFLDAETKAKLLSRLASNSEKFIARAMRSNSWQKSATPAPLGFICRTYQLCEAAASN